MNSWGEYYNGSKELADEGKIELPYIPSYCKHNAHMFYIKTRDIEERQELIGYLKEREITAVFHYIPLHTAPAGKKYGEFFGTDRYTTKESERLLRLPLYYNMEEKDTLKVIEAVKSFYSGE